MSSREATVHYMTPLGLHHIMGYNHHYGPGPWIRDKQRVDWTSVYYHKADAQGIGFNRTATGSNALEQYAPPIQTQYSDPKQIPEKYLLWYHHLPWDYTMLSGRTLWDEICLSYQSGVDAVRGMQTMWAALEPEIDHEQFLHVKALLSIQEKEAVWWRNACLVYFQTFSKKPLPAGVEAADHDLAYYESLTFPHAPGIRPTW
jgi:alpha-glucuronidase